MIAFALIVGLMALFVVIPLLIYTFLIFPNFDGVMQDLTWFKYDSNSQHYLFWFGFWFVAIFGGRMAYGSAKKQ